MAEPHAARPPRPEAVTPPEVERGDTVPSAPWWRRPVLAPIMADRRLALFATVFVTLQVTFGLLGLPTLQCPVPPLTSSHCPGCGMTRALEALGQGDWRTSLRLHAFAAPIAFGFLFVVLAAVLPARPRERLIHAVHSLERRTGLPALVLIGLVLYWGIRLAAGHGRIEALG